MYLGDESLGPRPAALSCTVPAFPSLTLRFRLPHSGASVLVQSFVRSLAPSLSQCGHREEWTETMRKTSLLRDGKAVHEELATRSEQPHCAGSGSEWDRIGEAHGNLAGTALGS